MHNSWLFCRYNIQPKIYKKSFQGGQSQDRWKNDGFAKQQNEDSNSEPEPDDEVRLWEDGFKNRYYSSKFGVEVTNIAFRHQLGLEYVLGLAWVLKYYYQVHK